MLNRALSRSPIDHRMEQLQEMLYTMYMDSDPLRKREADRWLREYRCTEQAWLAADQLLRMETVPEYALYFAAQTLHTKIQNSFSTLPQDSWESLRNAVVGHALKRKSGPKYIRTKLCLALAALAVQMTSWSGIIQYLTQALGTDQSGGVCLLEVCTVLPEECTDSIVQVPDTRRNIVMDELNRSSRGVLDLLVNLLHVASEPRNVEMQKMVFRCLRTWIRICSVPSDIAASNAVVQSLPNAARDPDLFDEACDAMVDVVRKYDNAQRDLPVVQLFLPCLGQLGNMFSTAAGDLDTDTCIGLARVFTEMAESYVDLIVGSSQMQQGQVIDLLLSCMSYCDVDVSDITFNFWFQYTNALRGVSPDRVEEHRGYLTKLAFACCNTLQFPEDYEDFPEDKQKDFKKFRQEIGDILRDCCRLLGTAHILQAGLNDLTHSVTAPQTSESWKRIEAQLYMIRSIAREVGQNESVVLPQLFQLLSQLPKHPAIMYTAALVVNRYSRWISNHREYVTSVFKLVSSSICIADSKWNVGSASAMALRSLCKDNAAVICNATLELYHMLPQTAPHLHPDDYATILEGICHGISSLPFDNLNEQVRVLANPMVKKIETSLNPVHVPSILLELRKLMSLIEFTVIKVPHGQHHPLVILCTTLGNLFEQLLVRCGQNDDIVESICRTYKRVMRSCGIDFAPHLGGLAELLLKAFTACPKASYLYCAGNCVAQYGNHEPSYPALRLMINSFSQMVLPSLQTLAQFTEHPDIVVEYFYFVDRCVKYAPAFVCRVDALGQIIQCAMIGVSVQHFEANKSICSCIERILVLRKSTSTNPEYIGAISSALETHGASLVRSLIFAIVSQLPLQRIDADHASISSLLIELSSGPKFQNDLMSALTEIPLDRLSNDQKQNFVNEWRKSGEPRGIHRAIRHAARCSGS